MAVDYLGKRAVQPPARLNSRFGSPGGDPVALGLVASLNRPGGNITGVNLLFSVLVSKRLGLLHEVVAKGVLIGALVNPDYPDVEFQLKQLREGARALGRELHVERARTEREIDTAFENMVQRRAAAKSVARELDRLFDRALPGSSGSGAQDGTGLHRAAHKRNGQSPKLTRPGTVLVREWQGTTHHVTVKPARSSFWW